MKDNRASFARALARETGASASASAEGYGFSGSVSASERLSVSTSVEGAWAAISDVSVMEEEDKRFHSKDVIEFARGTTQIYATQITTVSIGGRSAMSSREVNLGSGRVKDLGKMLTGPVENDRLKKAWRDLLGIEKPPSNNRFSFRMKLPAVSAAAAGK